MQLKNLYRHILCTDGHIFVKRYLQSHAIYPVVAKLHNYSVYTDTVYLNLGAHYTSTVRATSCGY